MLETERSNGVSSCNLYIIVVPLPLKPGE